MQFPDASGVPVNMLYPKDGTAFDMLSRFIDHEYADPQDIEMRGMLAAIGIVKGKPFQPDDHARTLLDDAAKTASKIGLAGSYEPQTIVPNAKLVRRPALAQCVPGQRLLYFRHLQLH
ncbi:hypothetical protein M0D69_21510 [Caballeronia sp. SEWSISQ10-4 2]|uniref:hypothetical protein n=1 Tax=Caballeronia sp. SEWSISQ10-4 2 TaxID=2937438 RepID=UPI0026531752|nr:hypothetical protein [Caballeronia sp. SEWSISQ10-4 2]MDN7180530.1 hypothetical protein [Caballeronia sp. SEWSISQ10-4 2]